MSANRNMMATATAIVFFDAVGAGIVAPFIPFLALDLGAQPVMAAQLVAVYSLAGLIFATPIGAFSDRWGRRRVVVATLTLSAAAYLGMLVATSLLTLFVLRAAEGALTGRSSALQALVTDNATAHGHAARLGTLTSVVAIGSASSPIFAAGVAFLTPDPGLQYRLVLGLSATICALNALAARLVLADGRPVQHPSAAPSAGRREIVVGTAGYLLLTILSSYGFGVLFSITALFGHARFQWGPLETAGVMLVAAAGIGVSRFALGPRLRRRFGFAGPAMAALAAMGVALGGAGLARSPALFLGSCGAFALAYGVIAVLTISEVSRTAPDHHRGFMLGVNNAASWLAMVVSASLSGLLFQFAGPAAPYAAGAAAMLLGLAAWVCGRAASRGAILTNDRLEGGADRIGG